MNVEIRTERYSSKHFIVYFQKGTEDIGFNVGICGFREHMEWLLYNCEPKVINGKMGFVFPDSDSLEDVLTEAKDFIKNHNLDQ